jgi:hypothetical protein
MGLKESIHAIPQFLFCKNLWTQSVSIAFFLHWVSRLRLADRSKFAGRECRSNQNRTIRVFPAADVVPSTTDARRLGLKPATHGSLFCDQELLNVFKI